MYRSPAMKREPMPINPMKPSVWNGRRNRKARIPKAIPGSVGGTVIHEFLRYYFGYKNVR
jgi:hypothetical protein